jgi:hypothetical protein
VRGLSVLTAVIGPALAWLAACGAPFDAPSAFEDEQYLCDVPHQALWQQRVADCRTAFLTDGSCQGVMSLRGLIDSQNVTVDSPVTRWTATDFPLSDGSLDRSYFVAGVSPYFFFSLDLPHFSALPGSSRSGMFVLGTCTDHASPDCLPAIFNVDARGGTAVLRMSTLVRNLVVDTREELALNFAGDLTLGGNLAGCYDVNLAPPP